MKKLLSIAMVGLLLFALTAVALAADEEVLSPNDATTPPPPEGGEPFIANSGADDATLVQTEQDGFYAEWSNVPASTHVRMSYDAEHGGELSLYVNGSFAIKIPFTDTGSWWDAFPESDKVAVNIPEGATVRIQVDEGDLNANIRNVILTKGVAEAGDDGTDADDNGDDETPKTGDPGMIMYIAMAGVAGGALVLRKKNKK